jgi:hypothetical protein
MKQPTNVKKKKKSKYEYKNLMESWAWRVLGALGGSWECLKGLVGSAWKVLGALEGSWERLKGFGSA